MHDFSMSDDAFVQNPSPRVPVVLCLDVSGSMQGEPVKELQEGVSLFLAEVLADELAAASVELSVVTFGMGVQQALAFGPVDSNSSVALRADGATPMGEAVERSLDLLEQRKRLYRSTGIDYYQPWLVLMSDGAPTDSVEAAVGRCTALVESRKLAVFSIGIGAGADLAMLSRFSPGKPALRLKGLAFKAFFQWLGASMARVSASQPGDGVQLDVAGIQAWGTL